jgi:inosose dehydratase
VPQLVGYELLPWEQFESIEGDAEAIKTGVKAIRDAGYNSFEALAGTTLTNDYARRVLEFTEWRPGPAVRSDIELMARLSGLRRAAIENELVLTTLFCEGEYINPRTAELEFHQAVTIASFIHDAGGRHLLVDGGPRRHPEQRSADIRALAAAMERIGAATRDLGIQLCFHPHIDTCVETAAEIEEFFNVADSDLVGLALDTAHYTVGGADPALAMRRDGDRVKFIHLKDVQMPEPGQEADFAGPARYDAFCDLGKGSVDLPAVWREAQQHGFDGPVTVELDATPDPAESARVSRRYVHEVLGF